MRSRLFPVVALAVFTSAATAQQKLELQDFTSKEGKYKIRVPGKATEMTKELDIGGKKVSMLTASVQLEGKEKRAVVLTSLELVQPIKPGTEAAAVEEIAKAAAGKAKTLSDKVITHGTDKLPGRDSLVDAGMHHMRYRAVLSGQRVYQLMILGPKDFVTSKDAEVILDSFEVTK